MKAAGIVKFKPGVKYYARSIGDHNCIWGFTVAKRTKCFVWLSESGTTLLSGDVVRRKVYVYNGVEHCKPHGSYSMALVLTVIKQISHLLIGKSTNRKGKENEQKTRNRS